MPKTTKAAQKAVNKYTKKKYDRINLTVMKGKKAEIEAHAGQCGESVNEFIRRAISSQMERDTATDFFCINHTVDEELYDFLTAYADENGKTVNDLIMEAVGNAFNDIF